MINIYGRRNDLISKRYDDYEINVINFVKNVPNFTHELKNVNIF